ncbi:hypothetical protein JXA80_12940, partial [bacterium]|nr:hypothetical protein [candidate division CSSED10-310 bacterium]
PIMDHMPVNHVPIRVIVCAGDDLTVVMPARHALKFTERFLDRFETTFETAIGAVEPLSDLRLSACAGIAFVKAKYPFVQAYELCESLCGSAKNQLERKHSGVAWHRITTSGVSSFDDIVKREFTLPGPNDKEKTVLSMMPYTVHPVEGFCRIEAMLQLLEAMKKMPRGSVRELVSTMYRGHAPADVAFARIRQIAADEGKSKQSFSAFVEALKQLTGSTDNQPLWQVLSGQDSRTIRTPMLDAVELRAAVGKDKEKRA